MYKSLNNFPDERALITHAWIHLDSIFTNEELDKMCKYFSDIGVDTGKSTMEDGRELEGYNRKSKVKFHFYDPNNPETNWIFKKLNMAIEYLNENFYNFDLNGYNCFQYTEYDSEYNGHYNFHMDTVFGENNSHTTIGTRKLSLTIALNEPGVDYEGGDFEFNLETESTSQKVEMHKGKMIVFPSFLIHRITPVTKGKRKSLVVWIQGPKFK